MSGQLNKLVCLLLLLCCSSHFFLHLLSSPVSSSIAFEEDEGEYRQLSVVQSCLCSSYQLAVINLQVKWLDVLQKSYSYSSYEAKFCPRLLIIAIPKRSPPSWSA